MSAEISAAPTDLAYTVIVATPLGLVSELVLSTAAVDEKLATAALDEMNLTPWPFINFAPSLTTAEIVTC